MHTAIVVLLFGQCKQYENEKQECNAKAQGRETKARQAQSARPGAERAVLRASKQTLSLMDFGFAPLRLCMKGLKGIGIHCFHSGSAVVTSSVMARPMPLKRECPCVLRCRIAQSSLPPSQSRRP
jgi:hypothetical protein